MTPQTAMPFGTAKRLVTIAKSLEVKYKEKSINVATSYKYLGVKLDPTMTMQEHFNFTYKRASSRLSLLSKMRNLLTEEAAKDILNNDIASYDILLSSKS